MLILTVIVSFMMAPEVQANNNDFKDVSKGSFAYEEIMSLRENGFINGYTDGTFKPFTLIKRAHVAALFDRSLDLKPIRPGINFKDVPQSHPYYDEIQNVYRAGIFDGTNGKFNPDAVLTRGQMAKIIDIAFNLDKHTEVIFPDVPEGYWAKDHVAALYAYKITTGSDGKFRPNDKVTRAHYAVFLDRALKTRGDQTSEDLNHPAYQKRVLAIEDKWQLLKPRHQGLIMTENALVTQPYHLGKVHGQALTDAVNMTNFVRYLSYLPDNIKLNEAYNREAQAASLVNAANQSMSHTPVKPVGMTEALFNLGYTGASSSNIAFGYNNISSSIQLGYMSDDSTSNRIHVGHRRWVLSPRLEEVGFGYAVDKTGVGHTAMKVISSNMWNQLPANYSQIMWPAETAFPIDFFSATDPWSVSLNSDIYDVRKSNDIRVQLTRKNDAKKWTFSKAHQTDGYFNVSTENYGHTPYTIIFQPNHITAYQQGDHFSVEIQNVYKNNGQKTTIQYETAFFDLK